MPHRPKPEPCEGGCLCGDVRYDLRAEPITLYACHCTDCQRQTGSAFVLSMIVPRTAIVLLRGDPATYRIDLPDGLTRQGRYCPRCATRLWGEPVKVPQVASLRAGSLDDRSWFEPVGHIWVSSAQPWAAPPGGPLCHPRQPPDLGPWIAAWQHRLAG